MPLPPNTNGPELGVRLGTVPNTLFPKKIREGTADSGEGSTPFSFVIIPSGNWANYKGSVTVKYKVYGIQESGKSPATVSDFVDANADTNYFSGEATIKANEAKTVTINISQDADVENDEHFRVELYEAKAGFLGISAVDITASFFDMIIENDDTYVDLAAVDIEKSEGQGSSDAARFTFKATRVGDISRRQTVEWKVSGDGSDNSVDEGDVISIPGGAVDFSKFPSGRIEFLPNVREKNFQVFIKGDKTVENNETFIVDLTKPTDGLQLGKNTRAKATILNDDSIVSLQAKEKTATAKEEGNSLYLDGEILSLPTKYIYTVKREGDISRRQTVDWMVTARGDKTENRVKPGDFEGFGEKKFPTGTIDFLPNVTEKDIEINVYADSDVESVEFFSIELTNPSSGMTIDKNRGKETGTIYNDDATVSWQTTSLVLKEGVNETTTEYIYTALRSGDTSTTHTVAWYVVGGVSNPAQNIDFDGKKWPQGVIKFEPGVKSKDISIKVLGDNTPEKNESFSVNFVGPSDGLTIIGNPAYGTITNDDTEVSISPKEVNNQFEASSQFGASSQFEGLSGPTLFRFGVTRTGDIARLQSVNWRVIGDGTATSANASDFGGNVLPYGTINFVANQITSNINIIVAGDKDFEFDERFMVYLFDPSNGLTINNGIAFGTIYNDDFPPITSPQIIMSAPSANDPVFTSSSGYTLGADEFDLTYTGADAFYGEGNNYDNTIIGGSNDDLLFGRGGSDTLTGGLGRDVFRFDAISDSVSGTYRDVITDFISGVDKLDFSNFADANELLLGRQSFAFIGSNDFSGAGGELRFDPVNSLLSGDTNGSRSANFEIMLNGVGGLSVNDFKLGNV